MCRHHVHSLPHNLLGMVGIRSFRQDRNRLRILHTLFYNLLSRHDTFYHVYQCRSNLRSDPLALQLNPRHTSSMSQNDTRCSTEYRLDRHCGTCSLGQHLQSRQSGVCCILRQQAHHIQGSMTNIFRYLRPKSRRNH